MRLRASDVYSYYRPSACELRVYLRARGEPEGRPSPYHEVLRRLGARHEAQHLSTFTTVTDLRGGADDERIRRTTEEIQAGTAVLYHPLFVATTVLNDEECTIVGEPDFLIRSGEEYLIRDSKLARRINERDHPEILRQLETYGWLFERTVGTWPKGLQVHSGPGDIVDVDCDDGGQLALDVLGHISLIRRSSVEPYEPVGWTRCGTCGYQERCWTRAEDRRDLALVVGVDKGLALALHEEGVNSYDELVSEYDESSLSALRRPWGSKTQRVGKRAASILLMAQAMAFDVEHDVVRDARKVRRGEDCLLARDLSGAGRLVSGRRCRWPTLKRTTSRRTGPIREIPDPANSPGLAQ